MDSRIPSLTSALPSLNITCVFNALQDVDFDQEKASWLWLPEAELCLPQHSRNVSNYKKVCGPVNITQTNKNRSR